LAAKKTIESEKPKMWKKHIFWSKDLERKPWYHKNQL
jgi:hypothetical protein